MQEISNSLRQKLGARPQPQTHPDPDLLTAYVERLLPPAECADVIVHLAECRDCREVVALSLSQLPSEAEVQTVAGRSRFWVPAFRWGGAVAVLAVMVTIIVEKPWHAAPASQRQAESTQARPQVVPATTGSTLGTPSAVTSTMTPPERDAAGHASTAAAGLAAANEVSGETRAPAKAPADTIVAELERPMSSLEQPAPAPRRAALRPEPMATLDVVAQGAARSEPRDASLDYVNRNLFKNENTTSLAGADANQLPQTPGPQGLPATSTAYASVFPPLSINDAIRSADSPNIVPPTTAGSGSRPPDTTLKSSSWIIRVPKKVGGSVIAGIQKAEGGVGGLAHSSSFVGGNLATPSPKLADNENEKKTEGYTQWRISNGTLMRSTDSTAWHEAYPQSSNLQFKVLVTKDDQIWAGGNNATIIHSWNAGVNWETLKVPDSGDITAITIDDGWQVKTSNGQTFVSQDHGKTWVPLEAGK